MSSQYEGIIPAYAGNTMARWHPKTVTRDHPRVCGEHVRNQPGRWRCQGSSPRMRGTRLGLEDETVRPGIIPAYAGNTRTRLNA